MFGFMSNECYIEIGYYFGIGPIGEIHCDSKKSIPVISSNSRTKYDPVSVIFGSENRRRVFSLQASNW